VHQTRKQKQQKQQSTIKYKKDTKQNYKSMRHLQATIMHLWGDEKQKHNMLLGTEKHFSEVKQTLDSLTYEFQYHNENGCLNILINKNQLVE